MPIISLQRSWFEVFKKVPLRVDKQVVAIFETELLKTVTEWCYLHLVHWWKGIHISRSEYSHLW